MLKRAIDTAKFQDILKRLRVNMNLSKVNVETNISFLPTENLKDLNNESAVFLLARIVKLFEEDKILYNEKKTAAKDDHLGMQYMCGKYNKIESKNL